MIGQTIFWSLGTESKAEMLTYLKDFAWLDDKDYLNSLYPNEMIYGIAFIADFLYSWTYTLFPGK